MGLGLTAGGMGLAAFSLALAYFTQGETQAGWAFLISGTGFSVISVVALYRSI